VSIAVFFQIKISAFNLSIFKVEQGMNYLDDESVSYDLRASYYPVWKEEM